MLNKFSQKDLNGLSLIFGSIFSFIPFLIQLVKNDIPKEGEHIFTFLANQIILNGNISILNAVFSIIGSTLIAYGVYALLNNIKKNDYDILMNFGLFLFLLSTIGFIISWSQDFIIIWGEANSAPSHVMIEFSLIFGFGIIHWLGISTYAFSLSRIKFLNIIFLNALTIISLINILLIIYTLFTLDPYSASSINLLYTGLMIGNFIFYIFCILAGVKILPTK
jgi:hypothetical protein|tara:strand:- start:362 stop:1027 length:666 start_codon:yes stop_codon:yes gene_type:complete